MKRTMQQQRNQGPAVLIIQNSKNEVLPLVVSQAASAMSVPLHAFLACLSLLLRHLFPWQPAPILNQIFRYH